MAATGTGEGSFTPSSAVPPQFSYDVFLSFRGEDTRKNFTDHLYAALVHRGISIFRDDDGLERREDTGFDLLRAIEGSRISVIVFSRNFAASTWFLDELEKILECKNTFKQIVLPVFYNVDPSDIRAQRGSFAEAFARHENRYKGMQGKVQRWRAALTEAANLSGWDLQDMAAGHESKAVEMIVKEISKKLNLLYLDVAKYPVGIESRVQDVNMLLGLESDDVRMVGIWGFGGIGKTTIAKAVYGLIRLNFEGSSFLANVRETSRQPQGLVGLQERFLFDILMNENTSIKNVDHGIAVIKQRLLCRRILLVLDDVDDFEQLNALAIRRDWFHPGSRIIVTTRDQSVLKMLEMDIIYEPEILTFGESLQLFSWHAFGKDHPSEGYVKLSEKVVGYAGGLPLALAVLGSFLFDKTIPEWKSALNKLSVFPDVVIHEKLKISFDSLNDLEKELFLDIACFFVGMEKDYAIRILEGCGYFPEIGLAVLSRRSLIRIDGDCLVMPRMIQDMGRDIVRRESLKEPGKRSRLWFHEDVLDVLASDTGTEAVEGLILSLPRSNDVTVYAKAFAKMNRLRLLQLNYVRVIGSYEHISKRLRWLCWSGFPLKVIPSNLFMEKVVVLDMRYSNLKRVWKGMKILSKLKILNLSHSYHLTEAPDFSKVTNLERLLLKDCTSLVKFHQSIECLNRLAVLDLENCKNLRTLPLGISKLTSLKFLSLSGCAQLEKQLGFKGSPSKSWFSIWAGGIFHSISPSPTFTQGLSSLRRLDMSNCNLSYVPPDFGGLILLDCLNLEGNNFCTLPTSISHLSRLRDLSLSRCNRLQSLPELPVNLEILDARHCRSLERISFRSDFRKSPFLYFPCCYKLVGNILGSNFRRCLLQNQELSAVGGFSILFPGVDFPDYFNYQSMGAVLSFVVSDRKFRGWILCVVIAGCADDRVTEHDAVIANPLLYIVKNKTKSIEKHYGPAFYDRPLYCQDHMWLHYAPQHHLELQMEVGDEVEFSEFITDDGQAQIPVKKLGVYLIYEDDMKDHPTNDQAMIQYASPLSWNVTLDKDVSTDQAVTDNMIVRHSHVRVPLCMSIFVLCLSVFVYICYLYYRRSDVLTV